MVFNFVQFAGAVPFSSLLGGKKRSNNKRSNRNNKRSNKRSNNKRSNRNKRSNKRLKRTQKRLNKRTQKRLNKRSNKRTQKRVEKRTQKRIKIKKSDCKCPKKKNLESPDGLGICAHCEPEGIVMKGKDGQLWVSKGDHWQLERRDMS
jgi:hypothetical protein